MYFIVGLLFILFPNFFENFVMYIIGAVVTLLGIIELTHHFMQKDHRSMVKVPIGAIISTLIGIIILVKVQVFTTIMMFSLGFILLAIGLGQITTYLNLRKRVVIPVSLYFFPILIALSGVLAIFNPFGTIRTLVVFFGAILLLSAVSELILYVKLSGK